MLEGWPLFIIGFAATLLTVAFGRRHPLPWALLGALFIVLRLPEFAVAAWVAAVIVLVYRISNPPASTPTGRTPGASRDTGSDNDC